MNSLEAGVHDIAVNPIYDWGSGSLSSTRIIVGKATLPEAEKDYYIDFSYSAPQGVDRGAVAMSKFDATEAAYGALADALEGLGIPKQAIADRNIVYCKSAAYHEDGAFNTIFATALWHGESGDVRFPRLGVKVHMKPGTFIVFDCHEPHCFLRENEEVWEAGKYADARLSHFLSFDLDRLAPEVRDLFGLTETDKKPARAVPTKGLKVCPRTGSYVPA